MAILSSSGKGEALAAELGGVGVTDYLAADTSVVTAAYDFAVQMKAQIVAVIVAVIASFLGVYLSFFIDSAPAPTIVLLMTVGFIAAFLTSSVRTARAERQQAL